MKVAPSWWKADKEKVHETLLPYIRTVEQRQSERFESFAMYEAHYDPNGPAADWADAGYLKKLRGIKENVVAVTVDTARASIAATEIRARFMTDDADFSTQKRAEDMELYVEQISKLAKIGDACRAAFFACAKKGTGVIKVYADQDGQLHVEPTMVDNIIVDDRECANGSPPRSLHVRLYDFDRDELIQQFPNFEKEIEKAGEQQSRATWRGSVAIGETRNDVLVVESWHLPMGKRGTDRHLPGRHVICVNGADLLDEEWHKPRFPFSVIRWSEREGSWYGIGLAERIIGHQRVLDKRNHQRDRQLDLAVPTTFVSYADHKFAVQRTEIGNVVVLKGDKPTTVVPTVVGMEIANDRHDARSSAIAEIGLSEMATRGTKPAGIESGAGLREFKDQNSQRFAMQEKGFEALWLDVVELTLDACKDLGDAAPEMARQTRFGPETLAWSDVDLDEVRMQIVAASTLARTPAGRVQTVLELTQAGLFSKDESLALLEHPDVKSTTSQYTASLKAIEEDMELIERGRYVLPEPFVNLQMAQTYAQNRYLEDRGRGAPEEILEALRTYAIQAADILSPPQPMGMESMGPGAAPLPPIDVPVDPTGGASGAPAALMPPMAMPQQVPSAGPPLLPAGTGPVAA